MGQRSNDYSVALPTHLYRLSPVCHNAIGSGKKKVICSSPFAVSDPLGLRCLWCHKVRGETAIIKAEVSGYAKDHHRGCTKQGA